ncbi:MAG: hypothetical protein AABY53_08895 [Bdellovibrionota bacterium]
MVLSVDKNKDVLDCYNAFYKSLNINSVEFTGAIEAYSFFIKAPTNTKLILTELSTVNRHDGLWLAELCKKVSDLPIVLITWEQLPSSIVNRLFSAVLAKPINHEDLLELVSRHGLRL